MPQYDGLEQTLDKLYEDGRRWGRREGFLIATAIWLSLGSAAFAMLRVL